MRAQQRRCSSPLRVLIPHHPPSMLAVVGRGLERKLLGKCRQQRVHASSCAGGEGPSRSAADAALAVLCCVCRLSASSRGAISAHEGVAVRRRADPSRAGHRQRRHHSHPTSQRPTHPHVSQRLRSPSHSSLTPLLLLAPALLSRPLSPSESDLRTTPAAWQLLRPRLTSHLRVSHLPHPLSLSCSRRHACHHSQHRLLLHTPSFSTSPTTSQHPSSLAAHADVHRHRVTASLFPSSVSSRSPLLLPLPPDLLPRRRRPDLGGWLLPPAVGHLDQRSRVGRAGQRHGHGAGGQQKPRGAGAAAREKTQRAGEGQGEDCEQMKGGRASGGGGGARVAAMGAHGRWTRAGAER